MENETLLSLKIVRLYDYAKTKKNVDKMMVEYEIDTYKYNEIKPPSVTPNYDIRYEQFNFSSNDVVGNYVANKLDKLKEINDFYSKLSIVLKRLTKEERIYFCDSYLFKRSESIICDKLLIGSSTLARIKTSCILKIALFFDKAELIKPEVD